jgi:hypothetical protein
VTIPKHHRFEDEGWARDTAGKRPDFQRLLKLAEAGRINWILVSERDRFGTKDADEFIHYRFLLRQWGCRLYDATGVDWTRKDIATVITAVVEGEKSEQEQHGISKRVLGGKAAYAKRGEWQGGPVPLGFDVACYRIEGAMSEKTNAQLTELWRVVSEGLHKRVKVYPDGRTERFDGKGNFPKFQEEVEVLRLTPSGDKGKVAAAASVFQRYASEEVSFTGLAHSLNRLGFRTSYGGHFQGHHVERMLSDPIYIGYYAWNRSHCGKFHRWVEGQPVVELNYAGKVTKNGKEDWVTGHRLFEPLVGVGAVWAKVQAKLEGRGKRSKAPKKAALYLSGLVVCSHCGKTMNAGAVRKPTKYTRKDGSSGERYEYFCSTYFKAVREGRRKECKCLRNGVFQDTLEGHVGQWLKETDLRLELLTAGFDSPVTDRLAADVDSHWQAFSEGVGRLTEYLAERHSEEYDTICREFAEATKEANEAAREGDRKCDKTLAEVLGERGRKAWDKYKGCEVGPGGFVEACLQSYSRNFDPKELDADIARLEAEHSALMERWADLPTPRAREKAKERFAALEAQVEALRSQQRDAGEEVARHWRELLALRKAVREARSALLAEASERSLRQKASALRAVIHRVECSFRPTGKTGSGWGKRNTELVRVTILPVVGEAAAYPVKGAVQRTSEHSRM